MRTNVPLGYLLPQDQTLSIQIVGADAAKVIHNLTTNDIARADFGQPLESFVTDVRGWVVAHGIVVKLADCVWLIGMHPDSARVATHIDRYIIREDARVIDHSHEHGVLWMDGVVEGLEPDATCIALPATAVTPFIAYGPAATVDAAFQAGQVLRMPEHAWQHLRITRYWPAFGTDIQEKCIPQEVDRNSQAISFIKGCYLGQETIARLDARGQLQKKMCLLKVNGKVVAPAVVHAGEKEVGTITSTAWDESTGVTHAIGTLRRGSFEPGQVLNCVGNEAIVSSLP